MRKTPDKLFVVRKYIYAKSAREAIKKERRHHVDDVWVDDDWKRNQKNQLESAIGMIGYSQYD